ncbi:hypothetical protein BDZ89DRAFT_1112004 [Hymenopellis radicata]|nr:hypothetical protein BDZ89DRAFT_1112004 [Hymenopellis radicata]
MSTPPPVVTKYIEAHKALDLASMHECQANDYVFSDPAFPDSDTKASKAMWAFFIKNREKNKMKVTYGEVKGSGLIWDADYVVDYVFNGRPVVNHIHAHLTLDEAGEKISKQEDSFDFYAWTRQSLGYLEHYLAGQAKAKATVQSFIEKEEAASKL